MATTIDNSDGEMAPGTHPQANGSFVPTTTLPSVRQGHNAYGYGRLQLASNDNNDLNVEPLPSLARTLPSDCPDLAVPPALSHPETTQRRLFTLRSRSKGNRTPRKRVASGGGRGASFSERELESLLDILEEHLPVGGDEWDAVCRVHNTRYPDTNRTTDSLRRKFALLYRKKAPTGDPRIPSSTLRAKKVRQDMTARIDLGDGDCSDSDGTISASDIRIEDDELPNNCRDADGDNDVDRSSMPVRSSSPSTVAPAFPIVHKRQRRATHKEDDDLMSIMKASLMQEREIRITERERAERERRDAVERREEEARRRAYERQEEKERRQAEREEAEKQREEARKNRDAMMQVFMMYITKSHTSCQP